MVEAREIRLEGRLNSATLPAWISHRAHLLNLSGWLTQTAADRAAIVVVGEPPMIEAMEVSCSLGPADVMVESISSRQVRLDQQPQGFRIK